MRVYKREGGALRLTVLTILLLIGAPLSAFAQGSIFGQVQNADLTTPANGQIVFFGFLDDTDEEIRLESSTGAGYDAGNWFDDFQNYLTEAPGNPYDYYFYNTANGEGAVLSKTIPNNSFQQEDITLGAVAWPAQPIGLTGTAVSATSVVISWNKVAGLTYHVYRRNGSSSGSFFRLDNPSGSLADAGVTDSFYVDNTVDGVSSYSYLIIAENASGQYSPHSAILNVNSASVAAPIITAITPNFGLIAGGEAVTISGSGFDMDGVTAVVGASLNNITVVSPFEVTGETAPSTVGAKNVTVTNIASGLPSNTLVGGYTYNADTPPVLAVIGAQNVVEGANLNFVVSASDAESTPTVTTSALPGTATFTPSPGGGTFDWTPGFLESGVYQVTFTATDGGGLLDSEVVSITVSEAGNQEPVLAAIGAQATTENVNLNFAVSSSDIESTPVASTSALPSGASFTPDGSGGGTFDWTPDFLQAGVYQVTFYSTDDSAAVDSEIVSITVNEAGNQSPVLAAIGAQSVAENANLNFAVSATDIESTPTVTTSALPAGASFTPSAGGGTFDWTPGFTDAGVYDVTFYATDDSAAVDSEVVSITVTEIGNQSPVLAAIGPQLVAESANLNFVVSATDAESIPTVTTSALPTGATFTPSAGGGTFDWTPGFTDAGSYDVTFYATDDSVAVDSEVVTITVTDAGNQAPVLAAIGPQSTDENVNLNFSVSSTDAESTPTASAVDLPAGASFTPDGSGGGTFDWTPSFTDAGVYNVTFITTDASLAADSEVVAITVNEVGNQNPVLVAIGPQSTTEGAALNVLVSSTDAESIPAVTTSPLPIGALFTPDGSGGGSFDWTPDFLQAGVYQVTFYTTDDSAAVDSEIVSITVNEAGNQSPVLAAIGAQSVSENANLNFAVTASDAESIPTVTTSALPTGATFTPNLSGGVFDWTPGFTDAGVYDVTIYATDDSAAVDSEVVTITVIDGGNQPPVLAAIGAQSVTELANLNFAVSSSDAESTPTVTTSALPAGATFTPDAFGGGVFDWTPSIIDGGVYDVTFYATDADLAIDSEIVSITVFDLGNQAPVLDSIGAFAVSEGSNLNFLVTGSDAESIPIISAIGLPAGATFTPDPLGGSGVFDWTPGFATAGAYQITFYATDDSLAVDSEVVAIAVSDAGNQAPIFDPVSDTSVLEGGTLQLVFSANDPDGVLPPSLSISSTLSNSTFVDSGNGVGVLDYAPSFFDGGVDTLVVFATDDAVPPITSQLQVVITTFEVNQPPTIDSIGPFAVLVADLLNFTVTASDSTDGDITHQLALSVTNLPANATFVDNGDNTGTFEFTPDTGQVGVDTVQILAVDQGSPSLSTTRDIEITVVAANQRPVIADVPPSSVIEGGSLVIPVSATDGDGDPLALSVRSGPANSSFVDNGDGTGVFTFTPDFTQGGSSGNSKVHSVEFRAFDGLEADFELALIQVYDAGNQAPVFDSAFDTTVVEGDSLLHVVFAADPDGTVPSLSAGALPLNMTFTDNGDGTGTFIFKPVYVQAGSYTVDITADDGTLQTTISIVIVVTDAGNQPPQLPIDSTGVTVLEGELIDATIIAVDPDSTTPTLDATNLPFDATFTDNGDGSGTILWQTANLQVGTYLVVMYARDQFDPGLYDSTLYSIEIEDVNFPPVLLPDPIVGQVQQVNEGETLIYKIRATDPDLTPAILSIDTAVFIPNLTFVDSGNGVGVMTFTPDYTQGLPNPGKQYVVSFVAVDAADNTLDSRLNSKQFTVYDVNRPPAMTPIASPQTMTEGETLNFIVQASDPDNATTLNFPIVTAENVPTNAVAAYVGGTTHTMSFTFTPDFTQAGSYLVRFIASDNNLTDTMEVQVDVLDAGNQTPTWLTNLGDTTLVVAGNITDVHLVSSDLDADPLVITNSFTPFGATLIDSGNGAALFRYTPDVADVGSAFTIEFYVADPLGAADTITTVFQVQAFLRGDANSDTRVDLTDVVFLVDYIFRSGRDPVSIDAADANFDSSIGITDVSFLTNYLFRNGPPPPY